MRDSWEIRFEWIQSFLQSTALVFGIGLTILQFGLNASTVAASVAVAGYTMALQLIPWRSKSNALIGGLLAILGVVTSLFAIAITGGLESSFLIYLAVPVFFAAAFHGTIFGVLTTFAAIAGIIAIGATGRSGSISSTLPLMVVFYALIGVAFSQARRILIEDPRSGSSSVQLERLESAHQLLADLVTLASSAELNPITIGRASLRDLAVTIPYASGTIAIVDDDDELVVATRGQPGSSTESTMFPITLDGERVGSLSLWSVDGSSLAPYRDQIGVMMHTVALAFANIILLQSIAHRAVREERVRLARELHDDIGPALVSVGLGIDLTLQTGTLDADSVTHLTSLRKSIGDLVEEVRNTVTHLRSVETASLADHAHGLAAEVPADGPSITIDIDETETPRPREAEELAAIMTEAVRNAIEHADASIIRIEGTVGRESGEICVCDNGRGIDPERDSSRRYGVLGMRERAEAIGAHLAIESTRGRGTKVTTRWGTV